MLMRIPRSITANVLRISHGYEIQEEDDPLVRLADESMEHFAASSAPGMWLVDLLPTRRWLPVD
jgi:hypothetical protein